ncbi:MAG: anthranilate phosphoribosyltransferase [Candidatus Promineifilaceae bacterium]
MALKEALGRAINGHDLSAEQAEAAMGVIMRGEGTPAQIGAYLVALRMKGESAAEIAGSARAMRAHVVAVPVAHGPGQPLLDTCGTGGDGKATFNISTTAAFVVAAAGLRVAKHGNRAASSQSGSADVLLALGANLELTADQVAECIRDLGIGFLYAVNHHPAMRHAIGPRRELGQRTIFNLLGPLTNPAGASHQLLGVYAPDWVETLAQVLASLGSQAALVVHGADGLDELSTTGPNLVCQLRAGRLTAFELDPRDLGLARASLADLQGGTPGENAAISRAILAGADTGPRRDIVLLNAAAAITLVGVEWQAALEQARQAVEGGAALGKLDAWIEKSHSFT